MVEEAATSLSSKSKQQRHHPRSRSFSHSNQPTTTTATTTTMDTTTKPKTIPKKRCKWGAKCRYKTTTCKFVHPVPPEATHTNTRMTMEANNNNNNNNNKESKPETTKRPKKKVAPLANKNKEPHPSPLVAQPVLSPQKPSPPHQASTETTPHNTQTKTKTKWCRYKSHCRTPGCPYVHPNDTDNNNIKKMVAPMPLQDEAPPLQITTTTAAAPPQQAPPNASRVNAVFQQQQQQKECYFGSECRRRSCPFAHSHVVLPPTYGVPQQTTGPLHRVHNNNATFDDYYDQEVEDLLKQTEVQRYKDAERFLYKTSPNTVVTPPPILLNNNQRQAGPPPQQQQQAAVATPKQQQRQQITDAMLPEHILTVEELEAQQEREALQAARKAKKKERRRLEKQALAKQPLKEPSTPPATPPATKPSEPQQEEKVLDPKVVQMQEMGFTDVGMTQRALQGANGDLQMAVEAILAGAVVPEPQSDSNNKKLLADTMSPNELERYKAERKARKKERLRLEKQQSSVASSQEEEEEEVTIESQPPLDKEKAARKAAKKERQRQNKLLQAQAQETIKKENAEEEEEEASIIDQEEEQRRFRQELKQQKERAAAKREEKKKKRHQQYLESLQRESEARAQYWDDKIADERCTKELLVQLCVAEFCRVNPSCPMESLVENAIIRDRLMDVCRDAYSALYKKSCRVVVKGMKQKDLNDRAGIIGNWDEDKGKFQVHLETKKGSNSQTMFFLPCNLEVTPPKPTKGKHVNRDPVYTVQVEGLYMSKDLTVDIFKSEVEDMKHAHSASAFLNKLIKDRNEEERLMKEREELERLMEEKARKRRKEQREREEREWKERQEEFRRRKAQYEAYRKEEKKRNRRRSQSGGHRGFCNCPECTFEGMFGGRGGFGGGGAGFFFNVGGHDFFFGFDDDGDSDDDDWDSRWDAMHEEDGAEKDAEAAEVLGVSVDATQDEIKRVFRKKALRFHPDKFRPENHDDGMTKEEAEEHFKELNSAYDRLMSRLDD